MAAAADNRRSTKGETLQTRHPNSGHPKSKTCTKYCRNHEAGDGRKASTEKHNHGGKVSAIVETAAKHPPSTK